MQNTNKWILLNMILTKIEYGESGEGKLKVPISIACLSTSVEDPITEKLQEDTFLFGGLDYG